LFGVKRIIGRRTYEEAVKAEQKILPYKIVTGAEDKPMIEVPLSSGTKTYAPEEISAMVLRRMKEIAEKELGKKLSKAVVTVPAYFNDAQRVATQQAGAIAGLEVLRVINEPTAAALGYGLDQKSGSKGSNVLIFDLGGGTFDVTVLTIEGGVFEVKATGGDTRCGGEDLDNALVEHLLAEVKKKGVKDPSHLRPKFKRTAETVKRDLSSKERVELDLDELGAGVDGTVVITREIFESLNKAFFERVFKTVDQVCKSAKLTAKEIDDIVLVGGSTRVPLIQQRLLQWGGKALCKSINPDEAVAYGAAVQGAILSGVRTSACQDMVLIDVTPLSLGIETEGRHHSIIIPKNSPIPCTKRSTYTTVENYQEMIDCRVFEGERPCTDQNHLLGEFQITDIERAKAGEAQIEVTFALDANGVLHVTAQDQKTKAKAECTINNACKSLSKEEIARMLAEASKMEESDAQFRKKVEVKGELESLAYDEDDDDKRDELLDWLDKLDLSAVSLSSLESKLAKAQRRAEEA
jgi:L1 cell adhesion molecule like protein